MIQEEQQEKLTVAVVVCAFTEERWEYLVGVVESLQQQSRRPEEIIIVVDHNTVLFDRVQTRFPNEIVIQNTETRGLSGARNSGVKRATCAIVAFTDDDAVTSPDWLENLLLGYTDSHVIGVGGTIEPAWVDGRPAWFPKEFDWVLGCTYTGSPTTTAPVQRLIGCNMSFRRWVFDEVEGFRSEIGRVGSRPFAGEETEFSIRISQLYPHYRIMFEPRARVYHYVPLQRSRWQYFHSRCYAEGLSKGLMTRFVGTRDGLAAERTYVRKTLPIGVWRGLTDTLLRGDKHGVLRAGAIMVGLTVTTVGFMRCMVARWIDTLTGRSKPLMLQNLRVSTNRRK
jgi:GT2 family glycosyltransferase